MTTYQVDFSLCLVEHFSEITFMKATCTVQAGYKNTIRTRPKRSYQAALRYL